MLSTFLGLAMSLPLTLQGAAETVIAVKNDDPETWVVEYPRIIRPFVVQYRQCLNVSDRRVTGQADFEQQHRTDIPRCAKQREKVMMGAAAEMAGAKTRLNAAQLDAVFDTVGFIHVARGRDLDDQFRQRVVASERAQTQYFDEKPKGLVLELFDASVVKSRAELSEPAQTGAQDKAQD
ncbi:MAG: hypothetical protein AAF291_10680 [Pseudomonadota bacterium]